MPIKLRAITNFVTFVSLLLLIGALDFLRISVTITDLFLSIPSSYSAVNEDSCALLIRGETDSDSSGVFSWALVSCFSEDDLSTIGRLVANDGFICADVLKNGDGLLSELLFMVEGL